MQKPFWVVLFGLMTSCGPQNTPATLAQGETGNAQQKGVFGSSTTAVAVHTEGEVQRGERSHRGESIFHMTAALRSSLLDPRVFDFEFYKQSLCERLGQDACNKLEKFEVENHWLKFGSRDCLASSESFNARELFPNETEDCRPHIVSLLASKEFSSLQ